MCVPAYQKRKNVERLMALRYDRIPILWLMNRFYPRTIAYTPLFPYFLLFSHKSHNSFHLSTANKRLSNNGYCITMCQITTNGPLNHMYFNFFYFLLSTNIKLISCVLGSRN